MAKIKCGICGEKFKETADYEAHMVAKHPNSVIIECPGCKKELEFDVVPMGYKPGW